MEKWKTSNASVTENKELNTVQSREKITIVHLQNII